ncbi:DUF4070 domain-containing protein [Desulfobulbus rhabdoformis]|uniref:DUF4070 domain-containing protein n=1 Tax=Desulfobulbus rhabdoformis TaxID=34032 RepID=UPI003B82FA0E
MSVLVGIQIPLTLYQRVMRLFQTYRPLQVGEFHLQPGYIGALFKAILFLGVLGRERLYFWKLFFWSLFRKPRLFPLAITYAIYGFHFRKVAEQIIRNG